jgi:choline dehydrogenase-like flavoprotein
MTVTDVNDLPPLSTATADICIVGAGAAGITLATELDTGAQTVSLVESGSYGPDEDTQALYELDTAGHPVRENFMSRARYFGGTSNLWAGRCMRLTQGDLARREWVPHSGWPMPYEELEAYYAPAARILRLPGPNTLNGVPSPTRFGPVERALFLDSALEPNLSLWAKRPLRFGATYRRQLQRSRNVAIYLNANVTDIKLNPAGDRVESCTAITLGGRMVHFKARRFVLACGGLETARLLLASRSVQSRGIGNQFDAVGRYYMDHPRAVFGRVKLSEPQKLPLLLGMPLPDGMAQAGIQFSDAIQRREGLLNHYLTFERHWSDRTAQAYQSFVHSMKIAFRKGYAGRRMLFGRAELTAIPELIYLLAPRELMPHFMYSAARRLRHHLARGVRELIVVNYCEQAPNPASRVYLGERRDRLNMPLLVLDWRICREDTESLMRLHELLDERLRRHRLGRLDDTGEPFSDRLYTDASHHIGTARMSADPRHGVVNPRCAVHGVDNLYVAGSAVFPTSGHANPTLTIVALALRLAAHLKSTTS